MTNRGPNRGVTSGKTKSEFIVMLLAAQRVAKYTDDELAEVLMKEFPKSKTDWRERIGTLRNQYNRGELTSQKAKPRAKCFRYDEDGKKMTKSQFGPKPKTV